MECMNECGNETVGNSKYCSETCKTVYNRNKRNTEPEQKPTGTQPEQSPSIERGFTLPGDVDYVGCCKQDDDGNWYVDKSEQAIKTMTREQLYNKIRHYDATHWIDSPHHKELMRRLHTMTIKQLEAKGYSVPAWKRQEVA